MASVYALLSCWQQLICFFWLSVSVTAPRLLVILDTPSLPLHNSSSSSFGAVTVSLSVATRVLVARYLSPNYFTSQKPQEALNPLVTEEHYWALFYMPLYTFIHNLLNVLVQIANKIRLQKKFLLEWYCSVTVIFFVIPIYLQSVPAHSANCVKTYTMACRRVLSSVPLQLIGSRHLVAFGDETYKLELQIQQLR
jgi:hypothetical protein